jgi:hypothetical protein
VPLPSSGNRLAEKRYLTVILRLVVDQRGQLVQGEVVDLQARILGRFAGWKGLTCTVRAWLETQASR